MSFSRSAVQRFAAQASRHRESIFHGQRGSDGVNNLQLGETKFLAAFVERAVADELKAEGFDLSTDAVATIRTELGFTLEPGVRLTYLKTGAIYEILETKPRPELGVTRCGLRKQNN